MNDMKIGYAKPTLRLPKLRDTIPAILLLLASRTAAIGMHPFGIALFAAMFDKRAAYIGIAAVCAGVVTTAGGAELPKYLIALILYWIFAGIYKKDNNTVLAAACGISLLFGGMAEMTYAYGGVYGIFLLCTECIISSLMYIVFKNASFITDDFTKRGRISGEEYLTAAITVGIMIAGIGDFTVYGISPKNALSAYAVMTAALNVPLAAAGSTGMSIGFISAMSGGNAIVMMGVYGLGALFASFMRGFGKVGCAVGFIGGTAVMLIYARNNYTLPITVFDGFAAAVLFIATPNVVHEYLRCFFTKSTEVEKVRPDKRMCEYLTARLTGAGEAFAGLKECFEAVSENRLRRYSEDVGVILDETADRICGGCEMRGKCWQTDFRRTYKNVLALIGIIEKEGVLTRENAPETFCDKCVRADDFIREIDHAYELYKRDVLRRSDAVVTRDLIASQYGEINRLFTRLAEEIRGGFRFLEEKEEKIVDELDRHGIIPYEVSAVESVEGYVEVYLRLPPAVKRGEVEGILSYVLNRPIGFESMKNGLGKYVSKPHYVMDAAVLQAAKDGFGVNGDSVTFFTTDNNKFCAIAADGMGSGTEARYESAAALRLLTSFIKAGVSPKTALGILNSAMCLNMDNEMYAAVDLLSVDLYSGDAQLHKIGSAKTLMCKGGETVSFTSTSVPAGILSDIRLNGQRFTLAEGDTVLIMTDGITEAGCSDARSEWLVNIMRQPQTNMKDLAKKVMDTALYKERGKPKDDMSIIALRLMGA